MLVVLLLLVLVVVVVAVMTSSPSSSLLIYEVAVWRAEAWGFESRHDVAVKEGWKCPCRGVGGVHGKKGRGKKERRERKMQTKKDDVDEFGVCEIESDTAAGRQYKSRRDETIQPLWKTRRGLLELIDID